MDFNRTTNPSKTADASAMDARTGVFPGERRVIALLLCAALMLAAVFAMPASAQAKTVVNDAILYSLNDGVLEYNVTHSVAVPQTASVEGCGISDVATLKQALGTVDAPVAKYTLNPGSRSLGMNIHADLLIGDDGSISAIKVNSVKERPIIGMAWRATLIYASDRKRAEILERNGALAVFMPRIESAEHAQMALTHVDGIMLFGGEDVDPAAYGELQKPHGSYKWASDRDISDYNLIQQAIAMDVPMLGICRNMQMINVALGGKLIQDVPCYQGWRVLNGDVSVDRVSNVMSGPSAADHERLVELYGEDAVANSPCAEFTPDTGYDIYDENGEFLGATYDPESDTYLDGYDCEEGHFRVQLDGIAHGRSGVLHSVEGDGQEFGIFTDSKWLYPSLGTTNLSNVYSAHHQAVDPEHLGQGLTIAAMSSDGIVEAIEHKDSLFALGVQWHPEREALGDTEFSDQISADECNAVIRPLVEHALIYADRGITHKDTHVRYTKTATTSRSGYFDDVCDDCGATLITTSVAQISSVKLASTTLDYNGKAQSPSVTVKNSNDLTVSSKYYDVTYSGSHKNVGKFKATITFKDRYSGTKTIEYVIRPIGTSLNKVTSGSKYLKVYWKKQSAKMSLSRITGYKIQVSTSSTFSSGTKTYYVSGYSKTYKKITKLKAKKKYYVRVATYKTTSGVKRVSAYSDVMVKTTK